MSGFTKPDMSVGNSFGFSPLLIEKIHLMQFSRSLHERIQSGEITCTIRIWTRPHVKVGGRYRLGQGEIEVKSIQQISLDAITPDLAQRSGFSDVVDLLKTAQHGNGSNVYLIEFQYRGRLETRI